MRVAHHVVMHITLEFWNHPYLEGLVAAFKEEVRNQDAEISDHFRTETAIQIHSSY